jgi:hypothetical protein
MSRRPYAAAVIAAIGSVLLGACGSTTNGAAPSSADTGEPVAQTATALSTRAATQAAATNVPKKRTPKLRADGLLPGVVPFRGGAHPQVTPTCNSPALSYFGGPIVQTPIIVPVSWSSAVNIEIQENLPQFFADVTLSSYWSWLPEYDTVGLSGGTEQAILPGTATAGVVLTPSKCPGTAACTVADTDIQNELLAQITAGVLPAPKLDCTGNTETIYMISFPPNVSVSGPDGAGDSCVQFCAYHNTGTYGTSTPLIYGVLMDEYTSGCSSGCGGNSTPLENSTSVASHELVEAVTDPDIGLDTGSNYQAPAGWGDNNNQCGEIADICDTDGVDPTITVSGRTWSVQELWSNSAKACQSTGTVQSVCKGTTLTGCRKCSCGDDGNACSGSTSVCETTSSNVLFGACEQCTSTDNTCTGTCDQSSTPADDDICSCVAKTSCPTGDNCGTVSDGCTGTISCGTCTAPQTCGGGAPGKPNVCGCTPLAACPAGDNCGSILDGCGGSVVCGTCTAPETCGGGTSGKSNVCGCTPLAACPVEDDCGTISNGCGGEVSCGSACGSGFVCTANKCVSDVVDAGADAGEHDAGAKDSGAAVDSGSHTDSGAGTDSGAATDSGGGNDASDDAAAGEDSGPTSDDSGSPTTSDDSGSPTTGSDGGGLLGPIDGASTAPTDAATASDDASTGTGPSGASNGCSCEVVQPRGAPASLWSAIGVFAVLGGARLRGRSRRRVAR